MNPVRRRLLAGFALIALPLGAASAAFACQSLATLTVNPKSGPSGTSVQATGGNYSGSASASNVDIHLDTRDGPILASTRATSAGTINVTFAMQAAPGYHTLISTQSINGVPKSGTPGRASFQVTSSTATKSFASVLPSLTFPALLLAWAALLAGGLLIRRRRASTLA